MLTNLLTTRTFRRGVRLIEQGEFEQALSCFESVIAADAADAAAHNNAGFCNFRLGRFAIARDAYARAAELDPRDHQYVCDLASMTLRAGDCENAAELYRAALELRPGHTAAMVGLGESLTRLGEHDEAADVLRHALRNHPEHPAAMTALGVAYLGQHKYADALRTLGEAVRLNPREPAAHEALARIYEHQGRSDAALSEREEAARLQPMSAEAQRALGDACLVRGEWKRAFTAFQKALYLNPDVTAAQEGLKEAHEQLRLLGELPAEHETRAPEVAAPEAPDDVDLDGEEEDESVEPTEWLDEGEQGDLAADDWDELPEAEAVEDDEADGSVESLVDLNGLEDDESEEAAAATLQDEEADSRPVDGAAFAPEGVEAEGGVPQIEPVEEEDAATELEPVEEESAAAEAFAEEPDETPEEIPVEEFDAEPVAASLEDSGVEEEAVAEEDAAEPAETAVEADAGDEASLEDLLRLGAACYQEERFEEALEAWREASRLDPAHPAALNNQAAALLAMGDAEQARNFCERAVYLDPGYGVARATLCEVLVELDRFDEARAEAEKLRRYNCDLADQVLAYLDEEIQLRGNRSGEGEGESNGKYTPVNGAQHLH